MQSPVYGKGGLKAQGAGERRFVGGTIIVASINIGSNGGRKERIDHENGKCSIRWEKSWVLSYDKMLTAEKLQQVQHTNKNIGYVYTLEMIIRRGGVKLISGEVAGSIN